MNNINGFKDRASVRQALSLTLIFVAAAVLLSLLMVLTNTRQASAAPYLASDVLGQVNFDNGRSDGVAPSADGLSNPTGSVIDYNNHRLYLSDSSNNRVLVYNLDLGDNLVDTTADYVLGQPDFTSNGSDTTAKGFYDPQGLTINPVTNQLYVADRYNNRILVFDTSSLANNMDASFVLGQADFITRTFDTTAKGFHLPTGLTIDTANNQLYVADLYNNRILVFDTSSLATNMDASFVLGQADFTTGTSDITAKGFNSPRGLTIDTANNQLYVTDYFNGRVLVFDTSSLANNMDASYVLGQPNFTSGGSDTTAKGFHFPTGLTIDTVNNQLYVADLWNNRVLVFDTSSLANNMDASYVLGQPDFVTGTSDITAKGFNGPQGLTIDTTNDQLYVADTSNHRILVFDTSSLANNMDAGVVIGQSDFLGNYTNGFQTPNATGFDGSSSTAFDTVNHRVFISDRFNYRVLVFNLNSADELVDKTADYVIGQPDFNSSSRGTSATEVGDTFGVAYDEVNQRLFVTDQYNERVLVYDVTPANMSNGMAASYVLGQSSFDDGSCNQGNANPSAKTFCKPFELAYDSSQQILYVADQSNHRVVAHNVNPSTLANNQDASRVFGQPDFTSKQRNQGGSAAVNTMSYPRGVAVNPITHQLFISENDSGNNRVIVYDISVGVSSNGPNALYVLGQPDFISDGSGVGINIFDSPAGIGIDLVHDRLYVSDGFNGRTLVFDISTITNGEDAIGVLGQADFDSYTNYGATQFSISDNWSSPAVNPTTHEVYVTDSRGYHRVMIFKFANITNTTLLNATNGASYTDTIDYVGTQGTESFAVTAGALPPGITLNPSTGVLSGTATTNGTYNFTVTLTDDNGAIGSFKDSQTFVLGVTTDTDGDGVSDDIEKSSPLGNDVNNDAIPDHQQAKVITNYNSISKTYMTAVIDNCATGFNYFFSEAEADIATQDEGYTYPLGLQNFQANCSVGATATITQYLDKVYDTSNWTYRKYINNQYIDFSSNITYGTATVNGITVTTVQFSITDGGPFDNDGLADGMITDPLGAALADGDLANTGVSIQLSIASGIAIILLSAALIPKKNRKYILERL